MNDEKRPNRSDAYQYKINEIPVKQEFLDTFSVEEKLFALTDEQIIKLQDLDEKLKEKLFAVLRACFTARQLQVITLYSDGYTQIEIAKILGVNQSSVTKSLNGNSDYNNKGKVYGGAKKKAVKIIKNYEEGKVLKPLMKEINELWMPGCRLAHFQTIKNIFDNEDEFEIWLGIRSATKKEEEAAIATEEDLQMISDYLGGLTRQEIVAKYKISYYRLLKLLKTRAISKHIFTPKVNK